jgi:glycosyltransferase involved in cell wall biosynthesis
MTAFLAGLSGALLTAMALVAAWNLATAPRLHRYPSRLWGLTASVLVPARDEAANLARLIPALLASRYAPMEVLVLDDGSRDGSGDVVRRLAGGGRRVRVIRGTSPPAGWTGKNWACHQLATHARGEILIFCDADVLPGPDAVARTVAALSLSGAGALTAFPRHEPGGWIEEAVIPLVLKLPVAALLPLSLVFASRSPALAAGNGQWFAWRGETYAAVGGHQAVRSSVIEDMALARRAKGTGIRLLAVIATEDLGIRMYNSTTALHDGFVKNLYPLLGGRPWGAMGGITLFLLAMAVPFGLLFRPGHLLLTAAPIALLVALRLMAAALFREPLASTALHPVGVPAVVFLALRSWWHHARGSVTWKHRLVPSGEEAG